MKEESTGELASIDYSYCIEITRVKLLEKIHKQFMKKIQELRMDKDFSQFASI